MIKEVFRDAPGEPGSVLSARQGENLRLFLCMNRNPMALSSAEIKQEGAARLFDRIMKLMELNKDASPAEAPNKSASYS
jgi:hypothetical protein